jgi:hypothetical protein
MPTDRENQEYLERKKRYAEKAAKALEEQEAANELKKQRKSKKKLGNKQVMSNGVAVEILHRKGSVLLSINGGEVALELSPSTAKLIGECMISAGKLAE